MSSIPTTQRAYITKGTNAVLANVSIPELRPGEILVKNEALAINPTDWKHIDLRMGGDDTIVGCDISGVVVAIAKDVTNVKVGDQVLGFVSGANAFYPLSGAFAEYSIVKAKRTLKAPVKWVHAKEDSLPLGDVTTWEGAASLPVAIFTTLPAFAHFVKIPIEPNPKYNDQYFLVWGGASSLGQSVIQIAKYVGFKVIATASSHNFSLLKNLGAEKAFDYREKDVLQQISKYAGNNITFAYDAITEPPTTLDVYSLLSKTRESTLIVSLPFDESTIKDVNPKVTRIEFPLAYMSVDKKKIFGGVIYEPPKGIFESTDEVVDLVNDIWAKDPSFIRHMPIKIIRGGLGALDEALDIVRTGKNSGVKIVVPL